MQILGAELVGFEQGPVDQQLQSRLLLLPAELRCQIIRDLVPSEVILHDPAESRCYKQAIISSIGGIAFSCKRALFEMIGIPWPNIHLRLPSLDAHANTALLTFPAYMLPYIRTVTIASPNWVVRPDRFQWSSDPQASLKFEAVNQFFSECVGMQALIIEVSGQSFSGLVNATLRQLEPLRVLDGVDVHVQVSKGPIPNRAMGPSKDTIEEVTAIIQGRQPYDSGL